MRIEFFGDTVESLRRFDPDTQRASGAVDALVTLPLADVFATRSVLKALRAAAAGALRRPARARRRFSSRSSADSSPDGLVELVPLVPGATVPPWTHLPSATVVVIEPELVRQEAEGFWSRAAEDQKRRADGLAPALEEALVRPEALAARLGAAPAIELRELGSEPGQLAVSSRPAPHYEGDLRRLAEDLRGSAAPDRRVPRQHRPRRSPARTCCARTGWPSARGRAS